MIDQGRWLTGAQVDVEIVSGYKNAYLILSDTEVLKKASQVPYTCIWVQCNKWRGKLLREINIWLVKGCLYGGEHGGT